MVKVQYETLAVIWFALFDMEPNSNIIHIIFLSTTTAAWHQADYSITLLMECHQSWHESQMPRKQYQIFTDTMHESVIFPFDGPIGSYEYMSNV